MPKCLEMRALKDPIDPPSQRRGHGMACTDISYTESNILKMHGIQQAIMGYASYGTICEWALELWTARIKIRWAQD